MFIDYFSGALADLKKGKRTEENALAVLAKHPRVSTWDMSNKWLRSLISTLKQKGYITENDAPYPWHRFEVTEAGNERLKKGEKT